MKAIWNGRISFGLISIPIVFLGPRHDMDPSKRRLPEGGHGR